MNKSLRITAILLGILLALLVVLVVGLTVFIDPNQYKDQIIEVVRDKTGRELTIEGKLGWSFFPWVGIETGRLALSNAPEFGKEPFAQIEAAGVKVKLLPLLHKEIAVNTFLLDGLKLNLARNTAGKTNWDDLLTPTPAAKPTEKTKPETGPAIGGLNINKVDIRRANITWKDLASGADYTVHKLDLKTGNIAAGKPVDVQLAFDMESGQPPVRVRVELKSRMTLDLAAQKLDVASLALTLGGLNLQTRFTGTKIIDAPSFSGGLEIAAFSPRALMEKLGIKIETTDKNALDKLGLKSNFSATTDSLELKGLELNLDDSRVSGSLAVRQFSNPSYRFDLTLDQIDLDRYFPPAAPTTAPGTKTNAATANPVEVPLTALRNLNADGKLRIQKLKAMKLHSSEALIQVSAKSGLITLGPNQAKLYSGQYAGRITLDARGDTPTLAMDESVRGVELAPMLKDALDFDKFTGVANLSAKVTAAGLDATQVKQTLNGTAVFAVQNGAIKGIDLKKMADTIAAAKRDKSYQKLAELTPQAGDETRFSQLGGTAQITNGVVRNNDMKIQSADLLNVTGQGSANLPKETLSYNVTVGTFPILIDGPFSKLRFRPDWNAIMKERLEEKKTETKEKLEKKLKDKFKLFK
jgi:AsmA protein